MEKKKCLLSRLDVKAFTLIELLVVVLIIGILAAVALPQYQKAVEKSKATQALTLLRSLYHAQEAYWLANGAYATQFDQLDISVSWDGTSKWRTDYAKDTRSTLDWSLQIFNNGTGISSISVGRLTGPYAGGGFVIYTQAHAEMEPGKIYCCERDRNGLVFQQESGAYCKKLFSGTKIHNSNPVLFSMP